MNVRALGWLVCKGTWVNEHWEKLVTDFFSNPSWNLELFDSARKGEVGVDFINPNNFGLEPGKSFLWSEYLKTMYSVVHANFHTSSRNEGDRQDFEEGIQSDCLIL